jgi:hypothetical protein
MAAANILNVPQIIKHFWKDTITDYFYDEQAFFGLVDKKTTWDKGLYQLITCQLSRGGGGSRDFDQAKANKAPGDFRQMQVYTSDQFQLFSVDRKLEQLTKGDKAALVKYVTQASKDAADNLKGRTCRDFWRNGGGAIGRISAISGSTITLVDPNDVRGFYSKQVCHLSVDDGSLGGSNAGIRDGSLTVSDINEIAGTVTFTSAVSGILNSAVNDYLFTAGDYGIGLYGVPAYVPMSDPGTNGVPTTIWGADRSTFMRQMSGARFTGSNLTLVESIKKALQMAHRMKMGTTHLFTSSEIYNQVEMSAEGTKMRAASEEKATFGYQGLAFTQIGGRTINLYADDDIPKSADGTKSYVWGLNLPTFSFESSGKYPMWLGDDGEEMRVEENANAREGRLGGYSQLITDAPGKNWNLAIT